MAEELKAGLITSTVSFPAVMSAAVSGLSEVLSSPARYVLCPVSAAFLGLPGRALPAA